jgi:hypothetical protein
MVLEHLTLLDWGFPRFFAFPISADIILPPYHKLRSESVAKSVPDKEIGISCSTSTLPAQRKDPQGLLPA